LAHLRRVMPDLIVLDLQMPEMAGPEVLRRLAGTTIPVLVVSGFLKAHAAALQAHPLTVVGQLEKPVAPAELVRAVAAALASSARKDGGC
jgi:CheY-like chemotaxis protein